MLEDKGNWDRGGLGLKRNGTTRIRAASASESASAPASVGLARVGAADIAEYHMNSMTSTQDRTIRKKGDFATTWLEE